MLNSASTPEIAKPVAATAVARDLNETILNKGTAAKGSRGISQYCEASCGQNVVENDGLTKKWDAST
jgi:hypothetical protein